MVNTTKQPGTSENAAQGAVQPRFGEVRIRQRGRLPHWEKEAGLYFVTFHLADSLPKQVLEKISARYRVLETANRTGANLLPDQKALVEEYSIKRIEEYFDRGIGACSLRDPRIGELVANAMRFWHGNRYRLVAWCIMPNHAHVIFRLFPGQELANIVRSWKTYTARKANGLLGRTGTFWQREYYDRLIREDSELDRAIEYVLSNPERAGLVGWKWVWSAGVDARTTAGLETGATGCRPV
ncbi:MAG: transposase [Terracidiphilus sp.]|jgi:REP element-mobilizing transposase RayT